MIRQPLHSPTDTLKDDTDALTFHTDTEQYDDIPENLFVTNTTGNNTKVARSNAMTGTKKSLGFKLGYGWGAGRKQKEVEAELEEEQPSQIQTLPVYLPPTSPPTRSNTMSSQGSKATYNSHDTHRSQGTHKSQDTHKSQGTQRSQESHKTNLSHQSQGLRAVQDSLKRNDSQRSYASASTQKTAASAATAGSGNPIPTRPRHRHSNESQSTLVGSAYERKLNEVDSIKDEGDTNEKLSDLRRNMVSQSLDYYVVPSEDAHGSEYVAESDQRRQYITAFFGSVGTAIVTMNDAYFFTDSRYWLQARQQLDQNWRLIKAGDVGQPKDWIEWLIDRVKDAKIGIDARMISHEKATLLNNEIVRSNSKLVYPPQNLVDLIWKDKPLKSKAPIFFQPIEFTGVSAATKLFKLREWVKQQPPSIPSYSKAPATPAQIQVGTLITHLASIAYLLNLRGSDIPHNPLFHAFLFVGLENATIFLDASKVNDEMSDYLKSLGVERREYTDLWTFLRRREWGEGKVLISPQTSYAISLMLTHYRYTVAPSWVENTMAVKNETELEGLRQAYLRDGVSFVRFLAWLEAKLADGYDITEYEAASRLTEFRRHNKYFMGIAYKSISATGSNAALPHYTPRKSRAKMIERDSPYLNDSGGQYRDGTCDTTRTVHFGRPTQEQCEAYTRVLQGHIAIDTAVFPEGTSGNQLDVLARKALWRDGLNYMHGTGHGFGSFLTVHEGPQSFASSVALVPGHVITNEPGFYLEGKWGLRIESALAVKRVKTKGEFNGNVWLGFERLTCVPIQTRMVKETMLTKEERSWLKVHNQRCYERLAPHLKDDKRAMKWLKREAERGIGLATGPGGMNIDWD